MIGVRLMGGLGNQLFQYATGWAFSRLLGRELVLDTRFYRKYRLHGGYKLDRLKIAAPACDPVRLSRSFPEWKIWLAERFPLLRRQMTWLVYEDGQPPLPALDSGMAGQLLLGYWQNAAFFQAYRHDLLSQFQLLIPSGPAFETFANRIHAATSPVAVHIRRGDYLSNPDALRIHGLCDASYYRSALSNLATHLNQPLSLFIFTDDPLWVRQHLALPSEMIDSQLLIEGTTAEEDMMLMSYCHHHVIANSTFSWWGAWLSKAGASQQVYAPTPWFEAPSMEAGCRIVPANWHLVDKR